MGCCCTLYHNNYAYSLLFYKAYMKRENADSWNSGLENEQILETYHYCRMLLTRHYDQRPFDETVCDAIIANGGVKEP